ncbi:hypothetical protein O3G_MSEX013246 [Manduca sexta]|uniref:Uncharacterized protein n=1 Tax=Manduca sexta TaxID=7130 RepID=A0A922CYZ7_MANSE|nr:hypothetical protein O3G_MSEX013246 [Manduca sexta]
MADDIILTDDDGEDYNNFNQVEENVIPWSCEDRTSLNEESTMTRGSKRRREPISSEIWQEVHRKGKKQHRNERISEPTLEDDNIQICVTCKDKLPKKFTLAKILNAHDIVDILKVKYLNPFKILIDFKSDHCAKQFMVCEDFKKMGWNSYKTWEVGTSYGIVKDIDAELPENELIINIKSSAEIVNVKRLNRRSEQGWTPSETVRIAFVGPHLPSYIYLCDMRIKVEPFVFPVTQCSNCWRFGHSKKMCPSHKTICPKCAELHTNCETPASLYHCSNCKGNHMSLSKNCPVYIKEKKIRNIMSEFNVSYRKAVAMYVPPSPTSLPNIVHNIPEINNQTISSFTQYNNEKEEDIQEIIIPSTSTEPNKPTYATVSSKRTDKQLNKTKHNRNRPTSPMQGNCQINSPAMNEDFFHHLGEEVSHSKPEVSEVPKTFQNLLNKLKDIIFMKKYTLENKIKNMIQLIVDYIVSNAAKYLSEISALQNLCNFFNG